MLSNARLTNPVPMEQGPVDVSVLRMEVEDAAAEPIDRSDRIDELANQMTGIKFQADVMHFGRVKKPLPHGRLREHVVAHDRQVERGLRAVFESDATSLFSGKPRDRFPKSK